MKTLLQALIFYSFVAFTTVFAQKKQFTVKYIQTPIKVDAVLDEEPWQSTQIAGNFWQYFPTDTVQSKNQTEIKMMFDDDNLYVGIKVYAKGKDYIIPSLRRDFRARGNDNITLMFDTFNDGTNAFVFGSNPYGVRREILLSNGGTEISGFNTAWDVKWQGESKIYDGYYICEWAIPLSAFKYREGETKWRFNSYQFDTQDNEQNTWVNIPRNQFIFNLAYMGDMVFEKPLGKSRSPIAIIPYVNTGFYKEYNPSKEEGEFKIGGDAKMTIGNSMNLDLTINPDFSQVEVDQQVTNLSRFSVALPEKRQFFIENSDLFGDFGNSRDARSFFSRRIGIARVNRVNKEGKIEKVTIPNRIIAGARLSGKLSNNFRLGFLNVLTDDIPNDSIAANNNTVVSLQQKLFSRSNLSFLFINRQATKKYDFLNNDDGDNSNNTYNRVVGLDYNLASKNSVWNGKYYFHKSFSPETSNKEYSAGARTQYSSKYFNASILGQYVGSNFQSDLGFFRRKGIVKLAPRVEGVLWPKKGAFSRHTFSFMPVMLWYEPLNYKFSDHFIISSWEGRLKNQSQLGVKMFNIYNYLTRGFDPSKSKSLKIPAGTDIYYNSVELEYQSDYRKKFSYRIQPTIGSFYNGKKFSLEGNLNWRLQPYFAASAIFRYDDIRLPEPYSSNKIWLVGPRFDVTFNKKVFWTTFVQYSSLENNFGVNSRLQWRFKPLSDLYLVYNDNYYTTVFSPRSRSLTLKFTYWLNI